MAAKIKKKNSKEIPPLCNNLSILLKCYNVPRKYLLGAAMKHHVVFKEMEKINKDCP